MAEKYPIPSGPKFKSIVGQRFGHWTVVEFDSSRDPKHGSKWICRCDCGCVRSHPISVLKTGHSQSCGCKKGQLISVNRRVHGMTESDTHGTWTAMLRRCATANKFYGARGISVCERWKDFENFLEDMGTRPSKKHSIDRIDSNGNYEPSNCRWATVKEQQRNRRSNVNVTIGSETHCLREWEEKMGLPKDRASARISRGWSPEDAITTPATPTGKWIRK